MATADAVERDQAAPDDRLKRRALANEEVVFHRLGVDRARHARAPEPPVRLTWIGTGIEISPG